MDLDAFFSHELPRIRAFMTRATPLLDQVENPDVKLTEEHQLLLTRLEELLPKMEALIDKKKKPAE